MSQGGAGSSGTWVGAMDKTSFAKAILDDGSKYAVPDMSNHI